MAAHSVNLLPGGGMYQISAKLRICDLNFQYHISDGEACFDIFFRERGTKVENELWKVIAQFQQTPLIPANVLYCYMDWNCGLDSSTF